MDHPNHPNHSGYNSKGGGSADRQNVHINQSGPLPGAQKGAHTSAGPYGTFVTEEDPEIIAIERQMEHRYLSRGPPKKPTGVPNKPKPQSSNIQPQILQRSGVPAQQPAAFAQGPPVANAAGDRPPQPSTQTHRLPHGQMHKVPHGQTHQVPHGQMHQAPHAQTHQVPHAQIQVPHGQAHQVPHGQTHQVPHAQMQVPHAQTHQVAHGQMHQAPHAQTHRVPQAQMQVPHAQTHQVPHAQMHQVSHGQTHQVPYGQPAQVQMPRATEGGTSSHDQQRNADRRRTNDRIPAVTANQRTTAGYRR